MESLSKDTDKRSIALQYLTISARKLMAARGNYDESLAQMRTMVHFIDLAKQYGCTESEITLALGYDKKRVEPLLAQVK